MTCSSVQLSPHLNPILVFGRDGQVGKGLQKCVSNLQVPAVFLGRADCDLAHEDSIVRVLNQYQPQVIINAAAYTDVDRAERQSELAYAINTRAPQLMANYMVRISGGVFIHYSSDYVFADSKVMPYVESDSTGPINQLNVYGQTKLSGEQLIQEAFALAQQKAASKSSKNAQPKYLILRTSWVYGDGDNFIKNLLRLASEQEQIKVVSDQIGVPTCADWLAEMSVKIANSNIDSGIYHVVPDGDSSWHGLALFAIQVAISQDICLKVEFENVIPILAREYSAKVKRPYNSRLNNAKFKEALSSAVDIKTYPHWQDQVKLYIQEYIPLMRMPGEIHQCQ